MVEIYKTKFNLIPTFMKQIFKEKETSYNLWCFNKLQLPKAKTTWSRFGKINGGGVWETLPAELKCADSLPLFKSCMKTHKCQTCNLGYAKHLFQNASFNVT